MHTIEHRLPIAGIGRPLPTTGRTPVHELFLRIAAAHPDRPAVHAGGVTLTYAQLATRAGHVAARLAASGVGPGDRVGVLAEPSAAMLTAVLGVLRAGAAYVPVDHAWPDQRIATVLADARIAAAVVTGDGGARLRGLGVPVLAAEDTSPADPPPADTTGDAAYLIYTSGSTGEPKGVLVGHAQLAASTLARRLVYPGRPVFLLVSPLAFDSSVAGLWGTLTAGGTLVVATRDEVRDPARLVELIHRHGVTHTLCVPSLYNVVLDAAQRAGAQLLASLDTVIVAGEPLPEELVTRHFNVHSGPVSLVNEYGPTEATVWASYQRFDAPAPVTIGGPVPGARLYVLDDELQPVAPGAEGELYVGGEGVTDGYFGRPDATERAFLDDPFAEEPGARMYRTGDRVRWLSGGGLAFLGRRDHQVKIRGHRVELGAVEAALRAVPGVHDAVAVPNSGNTALVGFVHGDPGFAAEEARTLLAQRLPAAMVPARVVRLDHFPLMFNGKVDRGRLTAAADEELTAAARRATPVATGPATAGVAAAWAEVLDVPDVPADANFFDLGGHSLAMFQLQDALERHTGVRPSVVALFRYTTVAAQAELISASGAAPARALPARTAGAAHRADAIRARRQRALREAAS